MITLCALLALVVVLAVLACLYVESANCLFTFVMLQTSGAFSALWSLVAALVSAVVDQE